LPIMFVVPGVDGSYAPCGGWRSDFAGFPRLASGARFAGWGPEAYDQIFGVGYAKVAASNRLGP